MKEPHKVLVIMLVILTATSTNLFAQAAPPPPPAHDETGNQPGSNAPITGGLFILLGLGAAYGGKKIYDLRKKNLEE